MVSHGWRLHWKPGSSSGCFHPPSALREVPTPTPCPDENGRQTKLGGRLPGIQSPTCIEIPAALPDLTAVPRTSCCP